LLILTTAGMVLSKLRARPRLVGLLVGGAAGILIGFLWTLANAWLLGPWFGAWSLPVVLCWCVGGLLGLAAAATARPTARLRLAAEGAMFLALAAAAPFAYAAAVTAILHDQHLTLVYAGSVLRQRSTCATTAALW
jgi:hypothetical protein